MTQKFGVWCSVSGSAGQREAWLKADGKLTEFDTREAAEQHANHLAAGVKRFSSTATFGYQARLIRPTKNS